VREAEHGPVPVDIPRGLVTDGGLPPSNSYVLPQNKSVYISVTKVACTNLRWMMARLGGRISSASITAPAAPDPSSARPTSRCAWMSET